MITSRTNHGAITLKDGRVLILGGDSPSGIVPEMEIYAPATNAFSAAGALPTGRLNDTATLLNDGRVLMVGGRDPYAGWPVPVCSDVLVFDPANNGGIGAVTVLGDLPIKLEGHTATLLKNGSVMVVGGVTLDANRLALPRTLRT